MTVDVIIPTYKPDEKLVFLMDRLQRQEYEIHKIIVINTISEVDLPEFKTERYPIEIVEISPEEFNHGGTRNFGASLSCSDIVVYLTQDAVPADKMLVSEFVNIFEKYEDINIAYGRQIPSKNSSDIERFTRSFNYPKDSRIKSQEDIGQLGIKTFFSSDVCAAYRRKEFLECGGFEDQIIFSEDMVYAGKRILEGERIAYVAEARVIHSHNYTCMQQFHRNFDVAVAQADYPEIYEGISSEGEGMKLVLGTVKYLAEIHKPWLIVNLFVQSGFKYMGYFLGKRYKKLPDWLVLWCTSSKKYWKF